MLEVLLLVPDWREVYGVVVAHEDFLAALNVPLGHDGHDEAEARVEDGLEPGVVVEGMAALVTEAGAVLVQAGKVLGNVETEHSVHVDLVIREHVSIYLVERENKKKYLQPALKLLN